MADNIMFKVNTTDYSAHVIAKGYAVRSVPQYKAWTDANGREHRSVYRDQVSGSFSLYFKEISEFDTFCALLESTKNNDTSNPCTVGVNNLNGNVTSDFFVEFDAYRYRDAKWVDMVGELKVTIKER